LVIAKVPPQYSIRIWLAEDGLPQNAVTAILQTHDGYLWVGTYSGLVRFDGVRFKVFDSANTPELQSSRVTSLFEDSEENLWIGHELGEMTRYQVGQFHAVEVRANWERNKISSIATDSRNDVWMMNQDGLVARLSDGLLLTPKTGNVNGLATMERAADGTLWIARNGRVSHLKDGELTLPVFGSSAESWFARVGALAC
jgi:ligand-binding sensor domain-containing protein